MANDADHFINIQKRDQIASQNLKPVIDFTKPEVGAANKNLFAMLQPFFQHFANAKHIRHKPA